MPAAGGRCPRVMSSASSTKLGPQMAGHRPTHHAATPDVEHHGQLEETRRGRNVDDIGGPELIRARGSELMVHQVWRRPPVRVAHCGAKRSVAADAPEIDLLHQAGYSVTADPSALSGQLGMDPRSSVGPPRRPLMNGPDLAKRDLGCLRPLRSWPRGPRIEAAKSVRARNWHRKSACDVAPGTTIYALSNSSVPSNWGGFRSAAHTPRGDAQQATHPVHRVRGLVGSHESEPWADRPRGDPHRYLLA